MSVNEGMSQHLSGAQTTTGDKTKRGRRRNRTNQKVFLISSIVVAMAVTLHLLQSSKCDYFDVAKLSLSLSLSLALSTVYRFRVSSVSFLATRIVWCYISPSGCLAQVLESVRRSWSSVYDIRFAILFFS